MVTQKIIEAWILDARHVELVVCGLWKTLLPQLGLLSAARLPGEQKTAEQKRLICDAALNILSIYEIPEERVSQLGQSPMTTHV